MSKSRKLKTFGLLFKCECRKMFTLLFFVLLLIALAIKALSVNYTKYSYGKPFEQRYYTEYISILSELTQEQADEYIVSEEQRLNELLSSKEQVENDYLSGKMSLAEFNDFNVMYIKAQGQQPAFEAVKQKHDYFDTLYEQGKSPTYFCDFEIVHMLEKIQTADIVFVALIIFLLTSALALDDESGMREMIISTTNGRRWFPFICTVLLAVMMIFAVFSVAEMYLRLNDSIDFSLLQKPIYNLIEYSDCRYDISILQFIMMIYAVRFCWTCALAMLVCAVFMLSQNRTVTVFVSISATLISFAVAQSYEGIINNLLLGPQLTGRAVATNNVAVSIGCAVAISIVSILVYSNVKKLCRR